MAYCVKYVLSLQTYIKQTDWVQIRSFKSLRFNNRQSTYTILHKNIICL